MRGGLSPCERGAVQPTSSTIKTAEIITSDVHMTWRAGSKISSLLSKGFPSSAASWFGALRATQAVVLIPDMAWIPNCTSLAVYIANGARGKP